MSQSFDDFYGQQGTNIPPPTWDKIRFTLVSDTTFENPFQIAGEKHETTKKPFTMLLVNIIERPCDIFVGSGKTYSLGRFYPGSKQLFSFITEQQDITITFQTDPQYTPSGIFTVDANQPIAEIWIANREFNWQQFQDDGPTAIVFRDESLLPRNSTDFRTGEVPNMARPVVSYPMLATDAVSINSQFVAWAGADSVLIRPQHAGAVVPHTLWEPGFTVLRRGTERAFTSSFSVMFTRTLASEPYPMGLALTTGNPGVLASIWHLSSDSLFLRIRRIDIGLVDTSVATDLTVWLAGITTQPTGGSSMLESPHRAGSVTTVETRSVPSGGAADNGERYGMAYYSLAITGAVPATNPPNAINWETLYDDTVIDGLEPLVVEGGTAGGFAILVDSTANGTIHALARAWFTEH